MVGYSACNEKGGRGASVEVTPAAADVQPLGLVSFDASVSGAATTAVQWSVSETGGGGIDSNGLYIAPATVGTFHVIARSVADSSASATSTVAVSSAGGIAPPSAACATAPLRTSGTRYYYCDCGTGASSKCVAGSDSNAGTSPAAPRRTLADAGSRFNGMNGGDTVALCRGGAWDSGGLNPHNSNCRGTSESTFCDFRDYVPSWGSSSSPRPVLNFGGNTGFSVSAPGATQGYRFWNLDLRQTDSGTNSGFLFFGDVSSVDICNVSLQGPYCGVQLANKSSDTGFSVRGSQFYRTGFSALLGVTNGMVIDNNYFEDNGLRATPLMHTMYLSGPDGTVLTSGVQVTNNDIHVGSYCGGVIMVIHALVDDLLIQNNNIQSASTNPNCYGSQANTSAAPLAQFNRIKWIRNRIAVGGATAIEAAGCSDCMITDNLVSGGPVGVGGAPGNGLGPTTRVTIQNNSVYDGSISVYNTGNGYIVENNAVWNDGGSCFNVAAPTARDSNNYCRTSGGAGVGTVWVDAPNGNFRPVNPGPLIGTASQTYYSPTAIGSTVWSASDAGQARSPPVDTGALQH
ncbi:MAG TPA: hypothetical protein VMK12_19365 [Anaeromyxobacteraceae bacterium]|nr:hypothetical protein [Anaeromyxobacteraceae bacterium]